MTNTWRGALLIVVRMLADDFIQSAFVVAMCLEMTGRLFGALEFVCAQGLSSVELWRQYIALGCCTRSKEMLHLQIVQR